MRGVKAEQAVCLSLAGSGLSSLHGIAAFKQLWTLDLSTCGIQSVEPLLPLSLRRVTTRGARGAWKHAPRQESSSTVTARMMIMR